MAGGAHPMDIDGSEEESTITKATVSDQSSVERDFSGYVINRGWASREDAKNVRGLLNRLKEDANMRKDLVNAVTHRPVGISKNEAYESFFLLYMIPDDHPTPAGGQGDSGTGAAAQTGSSSG